MILWGEDWNPNVRRIKAAANYAGLEITIKEYNPISKKSIYTQTYLIPSRSHRSPDKGIY